LNKAYLQWSLNTIWQSSLLKELHKLAILSIWMEWIRIKLISPGCFSTCSIGIVTNIRIIC
jgi:hypothetical protein